MSGYCDSCGNTFCICPKAIGVGDVVLDRATGRCGRVVVMHPGHANQRAYAWIQRNCQDGTVEREACWVEDLQQATLNDMQRAKASPQPSDGQEKKA